LTGWGGNFAQFSPRALCEDEDLIYEPFFDVVQRLQDEAAEIAISANPWDYEIEYADMLSEHEEEKIADYQRERDRDG
jgi:hypothetical protein